MITNIIKNLKLSEVKNRTVTYDYNSIIVRSIKAPDVYESIFRVENNVVETIELTRYDIYNEVQERYIINLKLMPDEYIEMLNFLESIRYVQTEDRLANREIFMKAFEQKLGRKRMNDARYPSLPAFNPISLSSKNN